MSAGFYKRRRGVLEHLESGTISLLDLAVHDYLNLKANLVIGGPSSIPPGVCITSAVAIHATCPVQISEKAVQRSLRHLQNIGWIKRWNIPGKHGNYPVLVCRASIHDLSGNEYRINGEETTDWRYPKWSPVGESSAERKVAVQLLSTDREEKGENREQRKIKSSAESQKPATPPAFFSPLLVVTTAQDQKLADVYPWVDRAKEYLKMSLWLEANRPGRKVKNALAFCQNWFNKIPCPTNSQLEPAWITEKHQREKRQMEAVERDAKWDEEQKVGRHN